MDDGDGNILFDQDVPFSFPFFTFFFCLWKTDLTVFYRVF